MQMKRFSDYQKDGNLVWAQRSSHGEHNLFEEHCHDFIELVYVIHGQGKHIIQHDCYEIRAGDVYIIMPGEVHSFPEVKKFSLEIVNCLFPMDSLISCLPDEPGSLAELPYILPMYKPGTRLPRRQSLSSKESSAVLSLLEEMIQECKDSQSGSKVIVKHLLIKLLIQLSRNIRNQSAPSEPSLKPLTVGYEILVRNVCTYLEQHFDQRITAEDLAKQFMISPRHLQRIFGREKGKSISTALQEIRMERAKQMLLETSKSIDSIATAVGFHDSSFFCRLFFRHTGCTPRSYRKQTNYR